MISIGFTFGQVSGLDSLQSVVNQQTNVSVGTTTLSDSLRESLHLGFDSIPRPAVSLPKYVQLFDSLKFKSSLRDSLKLTATYKSNIQAKIEKLSAGIDSANSLGIDPEKELSKRDSLNSILHRVSGLEEQLKSKLKFNYSPDQNISSEKLDKLKDKLNSQSIPIPERGQLDLKAPSLESRNTNLPDINLENRLPTAAMSLPTLPVEQLAGSDLKTPMVNVPKVETAIPDVNISGLTPKELPDLKAVKEKLPTDGLQQIDEASKTLGDIRADESKIDEQGSRVADKLAENENIENLKTQETDVTAKVTKLKSFKNPEEYKKQTLNRGREMVAKQMATYQTQLNDAITKVANYQSKIGTLPLKKGDLPPKRDPVRKLRKVERLVPGVTFQVQHSSDLYLVNINPSIRYQITSYWSIGSGWNERLIFGEDRFPRQSRLFGPRTFTEVVIFKGMSVRLEGESINAMTKPDILKQDIPERKWIFNYSAGIKKDFSVYKRVLGNAQFMYSVYKTHPFSTYPNRFNIRFGFEYRMKKRAKKN
jgi:hypothetical protein